MNKNDHQRANKILHRPGLVVQYRGQGYQMAGDWSLDSIDHNIYFCIFNVKLVVMRFRAGQEVVCIKRGAWVNANDSPRTDNYPNPKFNDIVTVEGYFDHGYLYIKGYNYSLNGLGRISFKENRFAPILENLDEIKETLNETMEI